MTGSAVGAQRVGRTRGRAHIGAMFLFRSLRWRIFLALTFLIAAMVFCLSLFFLSQTRQFSLEQVGARLVHDAAFLATDSELRSGSAISGWQGDHAEAVRLAREWSQQFEARVTLLRADGTVLADSEDRQPAHDNLSNRPEIQAALAGGTGYSLRHSRAYGAEALFAAAAIPPSADPAGLVRLSVPRASIDAPLERLRLNVLAAAQLALVVGAAGAFAVAFAAMRPFRSLARKASRTVHREDDIRVAPGTTEEFGQLSRAFNRMVEELDEEAGRVARARERLTSVLDTLVDGVFILDGEGRVRLCNAVAAEMVGAAAYAGGQSSQEEPGGQGVETETSPGNPALTAQVAPAPESLVQGRLLAQVVRDHRIVETWQACNDDGEPAESIFEMDGRTVRTIALPYVAGDSDGFIVLLQDMTELHRLERVRRDFVSNISHELRTPLASLRALTETLRDGALDDPEAAPRFLDRIETEVDSLAQMVQELLELSRIESGQVPFRFRPVPVSEVVLAPVERLQPLAAREEIDLIIDLAPRLPRVYADAERVHQVMANLVHNALKFSPQGASIIVSAGGDSSGQEVIVSVSDTGVGIPAEDRDRIFERFYKTDRARASGGTGLGLAIAKHIIQAHGGRIWVDSIENRGSKFSFTLTVA